MASFSVSMSLMPYTDYLNELDMLALCLGFFFAVFLLIDLCFVLYFTCCRAKQYAVKHKADKIQRSMEELENLQNR